MHKRIFFKHMEHSPEMATIAEKHLEKVESFLENEATPIYLDLVLSPSKIHAHHKIEARVKSPHYDVVSECEGPDFYLTLNRVIDTLYESLHEAKRRYVAERNHPKE